MRGIFLAAGSAEDNPALGWAFWHVNQIVVCRISTAGSPACLSENLRVQSLRKEQDLFRYGSLWDEAFEIVPQEIIPPVEISQELCASKLVSEVTASCISEVDRTTHRPPPKRSGDGGHGFKRYASPKIRVEWEDLPRLST